jgi:hypothetical protein
MNIGPDTPLEKRVLCSSHIPETTKRIVKRLNKAVRDETIADAAQALFLVYTEVLLAGSVDLEQFMRNVLAGRLALEAEATAHFKGVN